MSSSLPKHEKSDTVAEIFPIEQYKVLRQEILKRTELQYQVIGLGLVVLGTILTIGLDRSSAPIILVYPLLVLFLASVWSQNDTLILQIREYIIASVENKMQLGFKAWETYRKPMQREQGAMSILRSSRRILVGMQVIAIMVAVFMIWSQASISPVEIGLLILDFLVVLLTINMVKRREMKPADIND